MSQVWENIVADIIVHRNNKASLENIVSELQKKYDLSYKPTEDKRLRNEIIKLISKFKKSAKGNDLYYDLVILEMEIRPYPKEDARFVIERKFEAIKHGIGMKFFSESDVMRLASFVELYIREKI